MKKILWAILPVIGFCGHLSGQTPDTAFWIPNGVVNSLDVYNNRLLVAGHFDQIAPYTGAFTAIDSLSALIAHPFPEVNGEVYCMADDSAGGYYVGGSFNGVGGVSLQNLFHIDSLGNLDLSFQPNPNGPIYTIARDSGRMYVGGFFTTILADNRNNAACINIANDSLTDWTPNPDGIVYALCVDTVDHFICIGGEFNHLGNEYRVNIGKVNPNEGHIVDWPGPYMYWAVQPPDHAVKTIVYYDEKFYIGGDFTVLGSFTRRGFAALHRQSGYVAPLNANVNGYVYSIAATRDKLYIGGKFTSVGGYGRSNLACVDTTGALQPWSPATDARVNSVVLYNDQMLVGGDFKLIGSDSVFRLAVVDTIGVGQVRQSWNPMINGQVLVAVPTRGRVYAGGTYSGVGGVVRTNLCSFDLTTKHPDGWRPDVDDEVYAFVRTNDTLFISGDFSLVNGQLRSRLAAVSLNASQTFTFNPGCDGVIRTLAVEHQRLFVGGNFAVVGNQARANIASVNIQNGQTEAWNPVCMGTVNAIIPQDEDVYVGGFYTSIGGQQRANLARIDANSGLAAFNWICDANDGIYDMKLYNGNLIVGGWFTSIQAQQRNRVAMIDTATATVVSSFNPNADQYVRVLNIQGDDLFASGFFNNFFGQYRPHLAAYDIGDQQLDGWNPGLNLQALTLASTSTHLYCGGGFQTSGGLRHPNLMVFDIQWVTGIEQPSSNPLQPLVFPSPAHDQVTIRVTDAFVGGSIRLYDLQGREMGLPTPVSQLETTLQVQNLAKGIYLLRLETKDGTKSAATSLSVQ